MSTALYRRYRSARFSDLIGQDRIARTLANEVRSGNLAHAYLFAGIRGTGKTSTARILARAVNCTDLQDGEPCNKCTSCIDITSGATVDVLEIDAASNRGIDEMRDLRDRVKFLPAALKRKVYIIDEAHMLTTEAWNAFLKTLEEPPAHVLFILATTEPHKVPETVRSRVQRFDFRRVADDAISAHLQTIAGTEDVAIEDDAVQLIAKASQGSVRDALSLLDQAMAGGERPLTTTSVRAALGLADPALIRELLSGVAHDNVGAALRAANTALQAGSDPRQLLGELSRMVRAVTMMLVGYSEGVELVETDKEFCQGLAKENANTSWWIQALESLGEAELAMRQPVDARLQVEHCLLRIAHPAAAGPAPRAAATENAPINIPKAPQSELKGELKKEEPVETPPPPVVEGKLDDLEAWAGAWPRLIDAINRRDVSLAGVLRDCKPLECEPDLLVVGAMYAFHLERLKDPAKLTMLEGLIAEIGGSPRKVQAIFSGRDATEKAGAIDEGAATKAVLETFAGSRITASRIKDNGDH